MSKTKKIAGIWAKLMIFAAMAFIMLSGCASESTEEKFDDFIINFAYPDETKKELSDGEIIEKISQSIAKINNLDKTLEDGEFSGIGIIASENGYIIANAKILGKDNEVITPDGNVYRAELKKTFAQDRLALIKIEAEGLIPVEIVDTTIMEKGEAVVMLKNFVQNFSSCTVIHGGISSIGEEGNIRTDIEENADDANSLLLNSYGQIVGMSSYVNPETGTEFSNAKELVDDLIVKGYHSLKRLGIIGKPISEIESKRHSIPKGILITELLDYSCCIGRDVREGDIIKRINDDEVQTLISTYNAINKCAPGEEVVLTLFRQETGKTFEAKVIID